jgi:hypothetical protein
MVPLAQESRAADSRSPPRGGSDRSRRADVGACVGCARRAPGTVHRGGPAPLSDSPRAAEPETGDGPTEDHEEGAIPEETAVAAGRLGATLSRITAVLALSRTVVSFSFPSCFSWIRTYFSGCRPVVFRIDESPIHAAHGPLFAVYWTRDMRRGISSEDVNRVERQVKANARI